MRMLSLGFLGILMGAGAFMPAQEVVVDNEQGSPVYTETGSWSSTSNVGAGYNGGGYRFTRSTSPASTATWTPDIPVAGNYAVSAIFRRSGDRTNSAPYTIIHADGSTQTVADQTGSFSGELGEELLGVFRFEAGTAGSVTLSNTPDGNVVFISDAIRFVLDQGPEILFERYSPLYPQIGETITTYARVIDNSTPQAVEMKWSATPAGTSGTVTAVDDGTGGDLTALDSIYTALLPVFAENQTITFHYEATDSLGTTTIGDPQVVQMGLTPNFNLVINEIVASNGGTAFDPDFGGSADWVELHNSGPDIADLTGYSLSDNVSDPEKWSFPDGVTVPSNGYLIVWCDNMDTLGAAPHTNFALSASGEAVVLYDRRTATVKDQVTFPSLPTDESYCRFPNATGDFGVSTILTPMAENQLGVRGDMPTFSQSSGLFSSPVNVFISAPGATEIRYTVDGREPTAASTLYTGPIAVAITRSLRAKAFYSDKFESRTATASYIFENVPDRTIPIMNLVIDPAHLFDPSTGIYANFDARGEDWERPGHVVFMNPDGSEVHESGIGIRLNGGTSRAAAKKSFRLYFRNAYGRSEWTLPWLEQTTASTFNNLVLRANNNDGILNTSTAQLNQVLFFRDQILRDWHGKTGVPSVDGFFFALYINGQYWGLYNGVERVKNEYMQAKLGGSDWDVVKGTWNSTLKYNTETLDGDLVEWNSFITWLDNTDLSQSAPFEELKTRIDYPAFLRYFALNICAQNEDWPQNNWIATRRRGQTGAKWTFHQNDGEWGLGLRPQGYQSDTVVWAQGSNFMLSAGHNNTIAPLSKLFNGNNLQANRTRDINGILDNPQGVKDFLNAVDEILNFELRPADAIADVDALSAKIATEVPRESSRWAANMVMSASAFNAAWPVAVNNLRTFLNNRPAHVRSLLQSKFGISGSRTVTFQKAGDGDGKLRIYDRTVDLPWTGTFFDGSQLSILALPDGASSFDGWDGDHVADSVATVYTINPGSATSVSVNFSAGASSTIMPNDVIFNEYWINDESTNYPGVGTILNDWFELLVVKDGVDLRGWRVTNNPTKTTQSTVDDGQGSLIFPDIPSLASVPSGTLILVIASVNVTNAANFLQDDLDPSDRRLLFYRGNNNIDDDTDPGFSIGNGNEALILLAPGPSSSFADDIGVDFIAEGTVVTPASFFGGDAGGIIFSPPFSGIGNEDGAFFTNDANGGFNNDDGTDENNSDGIAGSGGWVVDPPATLTGDNPVGGTNILTPGSPNTGQNLSLLLPQFVEGWFFY